MDRRLPLAEESWTDRDCAQAAGAAAGAKSFQIFAKLFQAGRQGNPSRAPSQSKEKQTFPWRFLGISRTYGWEAAKEPFLGTFGWIWPTVLPNLSLCCRARCGGPSPNLTQILFFRKQILAFSDGAATAHRQPERRSAITATTAITGTLRLPRSPEHRDHRSPRSPGHLHISPLFWHRLAGRRADDAFGSAALARSGVAAGERGDAIKKGRGAERAPSGLAGA